ncbi:hypothetical protein FEDK69T_18840 [Flavobacterium enshiense DK69]|nr:hypothetical protein FEDK69T_18840 [Flavobacterium enshiense DK69]
MINFLKTKNRKKEGKFIFPGYQKNRFKPYGFFKKSPPVRVVFLEKNRFY